MNECWPLKYPHSAFPVYCKTCNKIKQLSSLIPKSKSIMIWVTATRLVDHKFHFRTNFLTVAPELYEADLMRLLFGWIKTWFVLWWGELSLDLLHFSTRFNVDLFSLSNLTSPPSEIFSRHYFSSVVKFGFKTFYWGLVDIFSVTPIRPFFPSDGSEFIRGSFDWSWRNIEFTSQ